ncbi:hypothetical protein IWQ62_003839 [Dispira parvispora]|uniref:Uncharacterized protein n=1 Tax=Dispira parvispora TaxID=1520584 RepID=A0A9W8AU30_9FUNG|nr:hypothetical protein IWQ62_003839 [Dispira parvispora]
MTSSASNETTVEEDSSTIQGRIRHQAIYIDRHLYVIGGCLDTTTAYCDYSQNVLTLDFSTQEGSKFNTENPPWEKSPDPSNGGALVPVVYGHSLTAINVQLDDASLLTIGGIPQVTSGSNSHGDEGEKTKGDPSNASVTGLQLMRRVVSERLTWRNETDSLQSLDMEARVAHTSVWSSHQQKLVVFGGVNAAGKNINGIRDDLLVLDTKEKSWNVLDLPENLGPKRTQHAAAMLNSTHMAVLGGTENGNLVAMDTVPLLNMENMRWSALKVNGNPPAPRRMHTAVTVGEKIVLYGGADASFEAAYADVFTLAHNHDKDQWEWTQHKLPKLPHGRYGHAATVVGKYMVVTFGTIAVVKGKKSSETPGEILVLDTNKMEFIPEFSLSEAWDGAPSLDPSLKGKRMSTATIVGIVFAVVLVVGFLGLMLYYYCFSASSSRKQGESSSFPFWPRRNRPTASDGKNTSVTGMNNLRNETKVTSGGHQPTEPPHDQRRSTQRKHLSDIILPLDTTGLRRTWEKSTPEGDEFERIDLSRNSSWGHREGDIIWVSEKDGAEVSYPQPTRRLSWTSDDETSPEEPPWQQGDQPSTQTFHRISPRAGVTAEGVLVKLSPDPLTPKGIPPRPPPLVDNGSDGRTGVDHEPTPDGSSPTLPQLPFGRESRSLSIYQVFPWLPRNRASVTEGETLGAIQPKRKSLRWFKTGDPTPGGQFNLDWMTYPLEEPPTAVSRPDSLRRSRTSLVSSRASGWSAMGGHPGQRGSRKHPGTPVGEADLEAWASAVTQRQHAERQIWADVLESSRSGSAEELSMGSGTECPSEDDKRVAAVNQAYQEMLRQCPAPTVDPTLTHATQSKDQKGRLDPASVRTHALEDSGSMATLKAGSNTSLMNSTGGESSNSTVQLQAIHHFPQSHMLPRTSRSLKQDPVTPLDPSNHNLNRSRSNPIDEFRPPLTIINPDH